MKQIANILSILALFLTFSHNVSATVQARDVIIIDEVTRVLYLYDFQTFMHDGAWYWRTTRNAQLNWPLIFK